MSPRLVGFAAAVLWSLLCLHWFDAAAPLRPAWLTALPSLTLALPAAGALFLWLRAHASVLAPASTAFERRDRLLVVALALLFRLPLAWQGSAAYVTPDGTLSGIVALHARDGVEHRVFVPNVPYSGSLKSHLTAPLALVCDASRAFALVSVGFYGLFVAAVFRLARQAAPDTPWVARAAGLYLAFSPTFVTRYSLSNDGNYVEVLALGAAALVLTVRFASGDRRPPLPLAIGLLLGLGFWCHILAVIHLGVIGLVLALCDLRRSLRPLLGLGAGFALGDLPGLLWNATNGWESFRYILPGGTPVGTLAQGPGLGTRALAMISDQWPVLMGYDTGYPPLVDRLMLGLAWAGVLLALLAAIAALRAGRTSITWRVLLLFAAANLVIATAALPHIAGNPRYLLFLMTVIPILLARLLEQGWHRLLLVPLVALGAAGSLAQGVGAFAVDAVWRTFVNDLRTGGVRHCETDFHLATKITFLSEEWIVCSARLGPNQTEYFEDFRRQTEIATDVALVPVNQHAAARLERRLTALGVGYQRLDLWKPVLLHLTRKVEPAELFAGRAATPAPADTPRAPEAPAALPSP